MRKRLIYISIFIICFVIVVLFYNYLTNKERTNSNMDNKEGINNIDEIKNIEVIIDDKTYSVVLENSDIKEDFLKLLPLKLKMNDLNKNEKYAYIDNSFITSNTYTGKISKGDIMLYQDNCIVIFYKDFETTYYYTKIGYIENLEDLGSNSVTVSFNIV